MPSNDLVIVVRRNNRTGPSGPGVPFWGWTLHRPDCRYLRMATPDKIRKAPAERYPYTVDCKLCKPAPREVRTDG